MGATGGWEQRAKVASEKREKHTYTHMDGLYQYPYATLPFNTYTHHHHRFEAHQRLGKETIKCRVRKATPQTLKMHMI